jgi:hypothetical protein
LGLGDEKEQKEAAPSEGGETASDVDSEPEGSETEVPESEAPASETPATEQTDAEPPAEQ